MHWLGPAIRESLYALSALHDAVMCLLLLGTHLDIDGVDRCKTRERVCQYHRLSSQLLLSQQCTKDTCLSAPVNVTDIAGKNKVLEILV